MPNATTACAAGLCVISACDAGFADCDANPTDGCEINLATDPQHCGACANACPSGQACNTGVCEESDAGDGGPCSAGWADCDGDPANGCETNINSNPYSCGSCGNMCPGGQQCVAGVCEESDAGDGGLCPVGTFDCDGDGVCEDLMHNSSHCGACFNVCGGGQSCNQGICSGCGGLQCADGWADCNCNVQDGCETSLVFDPSNCGACGVVCAMGLSCTAGQCEQSDAGDSGTCPVGSADCDSDGICDDLQYNNIHCGACFSVCGAGLQCWLGICEASDAGDAGPCSAGWADCDGDPSTGCETNIASDPNNCGYCGLLCGNGDQCVDGYCALPEAGACDPFANTGCTPPFACVVVVPSYGSDVMCRPAGNVPAGGDCNPNALCAPTTTCVPIDPYFNGICSTMCDLGGGVHGCPAGQHCASVNHPTVGVCTAN